MQFSKVIKGYTIAALADGYSQSTLNTYRYALNTMVEYMRDKEVSDITTEDLRGFMNYLVTSYTPEQRNNPSEVEPLSTGLPILCAWAIT
jgi:site-specific recombinase XerD